MCRYTCKYIHIHSNTYKSCMPQAVQRNALPGYAPGMYVSACICKYMQVFVCMSLQIHADTCRYMQIHTYTYIYIHIHADSDTCGSQAACHFTRTIDMGSLHWGHWHVILGNHFTWAIDTGYYLIAPYRWAGLLLADNVLFSELVRKLEIFSLLLLFSAHISLQTESSWISTDPDFPLVVFHRSTIMVLAAEQFKLQNIA